MTDTTRSLYYNRDGKPITLEEYITCETGRDNRVALSYNSEVTISTVWLGINHRHDEGPPLIFETMVFGGIEENIDFGDERECRRYSTIKEAIEGHKEVCKEFSIIYEEEQKDEEVKSRFENMDLE